MGIRQGMWPIRLAVWIFALVCGATPVWGLDLRGVQMDGARLILAETAPRKTYALATGPYVWGGTRIPGVVAWRPQHFIRLTGSFQRNIYALAESQSPSEGFAHVAAQLAAAGARELYQCTGNDCGSAAAWANQQFKTGLISGRDAYQRYAIYQLPDGPDGVDGRIYLALYATRARAGTKTSGGAKLLIEQLMEKSQ